MCDYRRDLDWWMDLLTTYTRTHHSELQVRNYSAISNFHTLQITTEPAKPFSNLLCLHQLFPVIGF
jgi:hypothetical protein